MDALSCPVETQLKPCASLHVGAFTHCWFLLGEEPEPFGSPASLGSGKTLEEATFQRRPFPMLWPVIIKLAQAEASCSPDRA